MSTPAGILTLDVLPNLAGFNQSLQAKVLEATRAAEAPLSKTSKAVRDIGLGLTAFGVGVAAVSIKMAGDFQSSMTELVTGAGESKSAIAGVSKGLLDMAGQVGFSAEALAKGMFMVESAGFHGAAGLDVMRIAAEGAKVGGADLGTTADALTTILTDYHMKVSQSAEAMNALVGTVSRGKTHMQDLAGSISSVLPFASALHVSLGDVMGAMATMTGRGIAAATAATNLKFTMMAPANETPKGRTALEEVGLTAARVGTELTTKGLLPALTLVTDAIARKFPAGSAPYMAALASIVGGTRGMGAALNLTGANLKTYQGNVKAITAEMVTSGGVVQGWAAVQQDANFKMQAAGATLQSFGIELGTTLLPALQGLLNLAKPILDWFTKLSPPLQDVLLGVTVLSGLTLAIAPRLIAVATGLGLIGGASAVATPEVAAFGVASDLALGPIGILAGIVGAGALLFFSQSGKQAQAAVKPIGDFNSALHDTKAAYLDVVKAKMLDAILNTDNIPALAASGVSLKMVTDALGGNKTALAEVNRLIAAGITAHTEYRKGTNHTKIGLDAVGTALANLQPTFAGTNKQLAADGKQWDWLHGKVTGVTGALQGYIVMAGQLPGLGNAVPSSFANPNILHPAGGGLVMGAGSSTSDSIPAMVSRGEVVINAAAVQRVGANELLRLNAGGAERGRGGDTNITVNGVGLAEVARSIALEERKRDLIYGGGR